MKKNIIYSPLLDIEIMRLLLDYVKEYDQKANLEFKSSSPLQDILKDIPIDLYQSVQDLKGEPFLFESIIGDHSSKKLFDAFRERNNFSLNIPLPPKPFENTIFVTAAAIMEFIQTWPGFCRSKKQNYNIVKEDSFSGTEIEVAGFCLHNVNVAIKTGTQSTETVSATLELGNNFSLNFCDLSAFENGKSLRDEKADFATLLNLIDVKTISSHKKSYLYCPCIEVSENVKNHLKGLSYKNTVLNPFLEKVEITFSETFGKLKLSEKGVEMRVETVASARMVFSARATQETTPPPLVIKNGLVLRLYHDETLIFIAYIPQENFQII